MERPNAHGGPDLFNQPPPVMMPLKEVMEKYGVPRPNQVSYGPRGEVFIDGMPAKEWKERDERLYGEPDHEDTYRRPS